MILTRKEKNRNVIRCSYFKVVLREERPTDANNLPGLFVFLLKSSTDDKICHKAVFVIGGHRDKFKCLMVHLSPKSAAKIHPIDF